MASATLCGENAKSANWRARAPLVREADVLVVASKTPEALAALQAHTRPDQLLLDVVGLPDRDAHHAQYRGVCW